jgi:hypothetical protein
MNRDFRELEECVKQHKTQQQDYERLRSMLKEIRSVSNAPEVTAKLDKFESDLEVAQQALQRLRQTKPETGSMCLRLVMGRVNMRMWKQSDVVTFKDEYNKFKMRTTILFALFPAVQLFLWDSVLVWKLHQTWLLYYYLSLAIRENILQVNGSNIHNWWIYHHYVSIFISLIALLFAGSGLQRVRSSLLWFLLVQGGIMFLQNRYQHRRHYTRRALGKAKDVDVAATETIVEKPTDLRMLIPLLFGLYAYEVVMGGFLLLAGPEAEIRLLGMLFAALGVGNGFTTTSTLVEKKRARTHHAHRSGSSGGSGSRAE